MFKKEFNGEYLDNLSMLATEQNINISRAVHHHQTVVNIGTMHKCWGHFLTDSMRLLWFINSKEYRENFAECQIIYFPARGFKAEGSYRRMLEILGVNTSLLTPVTNLAKYDRIILPDECFFQDYTMYEESTRCFTSAYVELIDRVRSFAAASSRGKTPRKVYYSYKKYNAKHSVVGEDKLEKYFVAQGYEVIYPENFSLDEQLKILINCESFAATVGSVSFNMLFCKDNTEVILIPRSGVIAGHDYQLAINQVVRQNINYIDASFSIFTGKEWWAGPFLYFISSNLRRYFHDEDTENIVDASDFWKYLRYSFGFNFSRAFGIAATGDSQVIYKHYSNVAAEYFGKLFKQSWPYRFRQFLKKILHR